MTEFLLTRTEYCKSTQNINTKKANKQTCKENSCELRKRETDGDGDGVTDRE